MRKTFDPTQLTQFIGSTGHFRISRRHLLTDGTKYFAEEAQCFWMMVAVGPRLFLLLGVLPTTSWALSGSDSRSVEGHRATLLKPLSDFGQHRGARLERENFGGLLGLHVGRQH